MNSTASVVIDNEAELQLSPPTWKLQAEQRSRRRNKIERYFPDTGPFRRELYPKHVEFFEAGADTRERCFMAGNRVGKTVAAAYELTCHLTGVYPPWWKGRKFSGPNNWWACGTKSAKVRDIVQAELLGKLARESDDRAEAVIGLGTGMIPGDLIRHHRLKSGVPNAIEIAYIKHATGGTSILAFKSYEEGRTAFEGESQEGIWFDEEPPEPVYVEALMRTMTTNGMVVLTFTPLLGLSEVVLRFMPGGRPIEA